MQMYVCGVTKADFVVWSPHEMYIESIELDAALVEKCVPALEHYYFKHYLPALTVAQS